MNVNILQNDGCVSLLKDNCEVVKDNKCVFCKYGFYMHKGFCLRRVNSYAGFYHVHSSDDDSSGTGSGTGSGSATGSATGSGTGSAPHPKGANILAIISLLGFLALYW